MFSGKVVLITGASSGIGAATAINFASKGALLALTGRNATNLQNVAQKCEEKSNIKPLTIIGDLTIDSDVRNILDTTIKTYGKLDILINNAGILTTGSIEDATVEQYDEIFATNVRPVYLLTNLAVPHLVKTKGNIVNVSSLAGLRAFPAVLTYCMSKAALDQFTRCVSLALAPKQVRVNSVNPGIISSDIHVRSGITQEEYPEYIKRMASIHPLGRVGKPEEVANAIVFLASDDASFTTGETLCLAGGRQNSCPR
ncbi:hypothetical protein MML48_2g00019372 [Holotrichia oblita]|uniref:Uncharacterized protein n=1 Tax=Holotrichia oblita TaxID=644536 RepID=A0ACB9TNY1_HOLOL|nr:hypothetical protein MML48_2g00019372 [Holotrichia oblita]